MNSKDVPTSSLLFSDQEFAAVLAAARIVMQRVRREDLEPILGDRTDGALNALRRAVGKMEMILTARKSGKN